MVAKETPNGELNLANSEVKKCIKPRIREIFRIFQVKSIAAAFYFKYFITKDPEVILFGQGQLSLLLKG